MIPAFFSKIHKIVFIIAVVATGVAAVPEAAVSGDDLENIRKRGKVLCGSGGPGGSNISDFQMEFCRFIAAAALGSADRVEFVHLSAKRRFQALEEKAVDILARSVTWTLSRDAGLGFDFIGPVFYDGQGFIAPQGLGVDNIDQMKDVSVCVETATTTRDNLVDYAKTAANKITILEFDSYTMSRRAFISGQCQMYSADRTFLMDMAGKEKSLSGGDYVLLENTLSKEPLSLVVREGDAEWADIVRWSFYATIAAEEMGITSKNAAQLRQSGTPAQKKLLGADPELGDSLGLDADWALRAITRVGNYGEIFERHLGQGSPYKLKRGMNDLWTRGGLLYAPPPR